MLLQIILVVISSVHLSGKTPTARKGREISQEWRLGRRGGSGETGIRHVAKLLKIWKPLFRAKCSGDEGQLVLPVLWIIQAPAFLASWETKIEPILLWFPGPGQGMSYPMLKLSSLNTYRLNLLFCIDNKSPRIKVCWAGGTWSCLMPCQFLSFRTFLVLSSLVKIWSSWLLC